MYEDMVKEGESNEEFKLSTGWLKGFIKRYGLPLQRKTLVDQKDPEQLIGKLVSFVLHVCRLDMKHPDDVANIIAIDETPPSGQIWSWLQQ